MQDRNSYYEMELVIRRYDVRPSSPPEEPTVAMHSTSGYPVPNAESTSPSDMALATGPYVGRVAGQTVDIVEVASLTAKADRVADLDEKANNLIMSYADFNDCDAVTVTYPDGSEYTEKRASLG